MEMKITENNGVQIINFAGEIDMYNSSKIERTINKFVSESKSKVIVDLELVPYMDSSGLGAFIHSAKTLNSNGGELKFINVKGSIYKIIELTHLTSYFHIYDSEEKALAAF